MVVLEAGSEVPLQRGERELVRAAQVVLQALPVQRQVVTARVLEELDRA